MTQPQALKTYQVQYKGGYPNAPIMTKLVEAFSVEDAKRCIQNSLNNRLVLSVVQQQPCIG